MLGTIDERKNQIEILFIKKQWLKGYSATMQLIQQLDDSQQNYIKDMYFCNTYLSIGSRRLGDNKSAISFGESALEYSTSVNQNLFIYNTLANCSREDEDYDKAKKYYDINIETCNRLLVNLNEDYFINDKLSMLERKADAVHNKGEMLDDSELIYESINIYKKLSYENYNKEAMNKNIANAYKNLNRIHNQLSTPLTQVL